MKHQMSKTNGSWHCTVCQWCWSTRRRTACPGMPRYTLDTLPSYLKTLPQLEVLGLQPPDLVPDGCYYRRLAPHWLYFYDVHKSLKRRGRPLPHLTSRVKRWLRGYDRCRWCGWSAPSDLGLHPLPDGFCFACHFEQSWLRQCKHIQAWAQERSHSEQVLILDTETVGPLNDLDVAELAILDMQGSVLLKAQLRHRCWTAKLEWHYPWTWSSVRLTPPPPDLADIWPQVMALFELSSTVIAYNVAFHREALAQSAHRYGLSLPPLRGCA